MEVIPASAVEVMVAVLVYPLRSGATHQGSIRTALADWTRHHRRHMSGQ
jgi:hypothetical protein